MTPGTEFLRANVKKVGAAWERAVLDAVNAGDAVTWPLIPVDVAEGSYILVAADYLAIGDAEDFVRVPLGGPAMQAAIEGLGLMLPTSRMVDRIWSAALYFGVAVAPEGIAASAAMATPPVIEQHNGMVERAIVARRLEHAADLEARPRTKLAAGHKKDVCVSPVLLEHPDRLDFYGWHRLDGRPIQGESYAHGASYFDYSHGGRGVSAEMVLRGETVRLLEVLEDPKECAILSAHGPLKGARYAAFR